MAVDPSQPRQTLAFVLNGAVTRVSDAGPTTTLLDWLRADQRLTGTKEGCAEGDCGACTVLVGRRDNDGVTRWRPANACILFLGMLDGAAVATVDALAAEGALEPIQQAMVERHGSQCGFCTPGIVMALYAARVSRPESAAAPDRAEIADALAGNLCRCTGYGPILAAAEDAFAAPRTAFEKAARARDDTLLAELAQDRRDLALVSAEGVFHAPRSLASALAIAGGGSDAVIVAGATDVGLWATKALKIMPTILHLGQVAELRALEETADGGLAIGAGVSYAEAEAAIGARWPDFAELIRRIGSPQVRAQGTIGGNVANGSPIGDTPPALIALGARLRLRSAAGGREIPLEDFFIDYGKQDRAPGEIVEAVVIPAGGGALRCYKISKRFDQDISALCGCFNVIVDNGVVSAARIAFGGMAATPRRASAVEAALIGKPWSMADVDAAAASLAQDFAPISDHRASAGYRLTVARNLLRKYALETGADGAAAPQTRLVGVGAAFG
jgi:xanthine dehydrogenase small subunit